MQKSQLYNMLHYVILILKNCQKVVKVSHVKIINSYSILMGILLPFFIMCSGGDLVAQALDAEKCSHFSTDPDDRSGPPILFYADLWDGPQRLPTESPGTGRAEFILDRETLKLSWRVTFRDLTTDPVGLHIHGPVPAEGDAPAIFNLASEYPVSPVEGEKILSLGEVAYLVQHLLFVNLHTEKYPQGELRGPVKKIAPQC